MYESLALGAEGADGLGGAPKLAFAHTAQLLLEALAIAGARVGVDADLGFVARGDTLV